MAATCGAGAEFVARSTALAVGHHHDVPGRCTDRPSSPGDHAEGGSGTEDLTESNGLQQWEVRWLLHTVLEQEFRSVQPPRAEEVHCDDLKRLSDKQGSSGGYVGGELEK